MTPEAAGDAWYGSSEGARSLGALPAPSSGTGLDGANLGPGSRHAMTSPAAITEDPEPSTDRRSAAHESLVRACTAEERSLPAIHGAPFADVEDRGPHHATGGEVPGLPAASSHEGLLDEVRP
jgi:hypothetical protein